MSADLTSITRLEFEALEPTLAQKLAPRVKRLGYLGEFFKCAAHQPEALKSFIDFTEHSKGGLPENLVEVVALTTAGWMSNAYERNQHERLSLRLGFGRDWVEDVNQLAPQASARLSPEEKLVQRLVLSVLDSKGKDASALLESAVRSLGEREAIAILMLIGRYVVHGLFVNTLDLKPPVPSVFEDGFAA